MTRLSLPLLALLILTCSCATRTGRGPTWHHAEPDRSFGPDMEILNGVTTHAQFVDVPLREVTLFWQEEWKLYTMYADTVNLEAVVSWTATGSAQDALSTFLAEQGLTYKRTNLRTLLLLPDATGPRAEFADFPPPPGVLLGHPGYRGRHDFEFIDEPVGDIACAIAAREHLRCELSPEVKARGRTTFMTDDDTVGEALYLLHVVEGLAYELDRERMIHVRLHPTSWTDE